MPLVMGYTWDCFRADLTGVRAWSAGSCRGVVSRGWTSCVSQGGVYAGIGDVIAVVEAFGVDAEQDLDAVHRPLGDPGRGDPGRQPEGYGCVAQVVGPTGQGGGNLGGGQGRVRASAQTSLIAVEATGWPRSLLKIRPSGATPKVSIWSRTMATSSGGMGHAAGFVGGTVFESAFVVG